MTATPHQGEFATTPAIGRSLVPFVAAGPAAPPPVAAFPLRATLLAAVVGLAAGTGAIGAYQGRHHLSWLGFGRTDAAAAVMHRLEDQVTRLQGSVEALRVADVPHVDDQWRGLKHSVDALKQDVEQVRTAGAATVVQLSAKIDKADHDPLPKLTDIAARLDRIERDGAIRSADAPAQKLAELTGRIDRLEKQGNSVPGPAPTHLAPAPPPVPAPVAHSAALPPPAAKPAVPASLPAAHAEVTKVPVTPPAKAPAAPPAPAVTGWVLRDVYDGVALVEGRRGLREVQPGEFLPGAGEIRSIERHGRAWVVMTSRGVIASAAN